MERSWSSNTDESYGLVPQPCATNPGKGPRPVAGREQRWLPGTCPSLRPAVAVTARGGGVPVARVNSSHRRQLSPAGRVTHATEARSRVGPPEDSGGLPRARLVA